MQQTSRPTRLLVSIAAPQDVPLLTAWEKHLRPLQQAGQIAFWSEQVLLAGDDRVKLIQMHLD